jgi:DNA-binding NarL/FixJ family response regulator
MSTLLRSNSAGICLLVVEPSRLRCDSLVKRFASTGRFSRVVGRITISAARRAALANVANVALVSSDMQEGNERACDLVQFFATLPRPLRSLVIAQEWHRAEVIEAFSHGAKGIVTSRGTDIQRLCKAVVCVHMGHVWANSEQLNHALDHFAVKASNGRREAHAKSSLSAREQEISKLLAKGASNKEIANELHISERTVKNHLGNIFEKIGVSSRVRAALRLVG